MKEKDKIKKLELKIAKLEGEVNAYKEANKILADRIVNYNIMPPITIPNSPRMPPYTIPW